MRERLLLFKEMIMQQIVYLIIHTLNKSKVNSHRFKETKNTSH